MASPWSSKVETAPVGSAVNYRPSGFKKNQQTNPSVEETTSISWKEIKDRLKEKRYSNIYQPSVEKTKTTTTTIVAWWFQPIETSFSSAFRGHITWWSHLGEGSGSAELSPFESHHTETLMAVKWELSGISWNYSTINGINVHGISHSNTLPSAKCSRRWAPKSSTNLSDMTSKLSIHVYPERSWDFPNMKLLSNQHSRHHRHQGGAPLN